MSVKCGNCHGVHDSVNDVRACHGLGARPEAVRSSSGTARKKAKKRRVVHMAPKTSSAASRTRRRGEDPSVSKARKKLGQKKWAQGSVYAPPNDLELHKMIGRTQSYDDSF